MLVLQRQEQERIVIIVPPSKGERLIEAQFVRVSSKGSARIGINAPVDCSIDREEIYRSKMNEKKNAARAV